MKRIFLSIGTVTSLVLLSGCEEAFMGPEKQKSAEVVAATPSRPAPPAPKNGTMTPKQFVQLVTFADESVRSQALEVEIAKQQILAAEGAFEPEFYAELSRSLEHRQTSANQISSAVGGADPFWERSTEGKMGVLVKSKTGVTVDLYTQMEQVKNSLQASANIASPENSGKAGISLTVPLLRNAGKAVNGSGIKIAQIDEEIAGLTTDLVKSKRAYEGLQTYTAYQRARARVATRQEMLNLTQKLAREIEGQMESGLSSPTDLTVARGRVAESRAALTQAKIELAEHRDGLQIFFTGLPTKSPKDIWLPASGLSAPKNARLRVGALNDIYRRRPEIRIQELQIERREVETLVAENKARPELNLKADFAQTALSTEYLPFRDLFASDNPYHTWRVGFEFRRKLGGNRQGKAELKAAQLREQQAELTMNAFRQRLAGEVNSISGIVARAQQAVNENTRYHQAQSRLVKDERNKAGAGLSTQAEVLTRKIDEVLSREARNDAIAQLSQSYYLSGYVNGTLLSAFGAD